MNCKMCSDVYAGTPRVSAAGECRGGQVALGNDGQRGEGKDDGHGVLERGTVEMRSLCRNNLQTARADCAARAKTHDNHKQGEAKFLKSISFWKNSCKTDA